MIHLTRQRDKTEAPPCIVNEQLTIHPVAPGAPGEQTALRWLGIFFDRKLTFRRHVEVRTAKARRVAQHVRSLAKTTCGPPAASLRKAVISCVLSTALYGTECWYGGRTKATKQRRQDRSSEVSARLGWHIAAINKVITTAARGILPVWRTTPIPALLRDSALPSAEAALEEARLRFAAHLQTVDASHPLTARCTAPIRSRGRGAGTPQRARTKVQRLALLLPSIPRPTLAAPHYTKDCRRDPTRGQDKKTASTQFTTWWENLPPNDLTIFSDGSEQYVDGDRRVTYGYAAYQGRRRLYTGRGSLHECSHVFDAEAVGAWRGLQVALNQPHLRLRRIWLCIDSTSVLWGIRGNAPLSSQWAFLRVHNAMEIWDIHTKWCPGHTGILGNEEADSLADREAKDPSAPFGIAANPTVSGIRTAARRQVELARQAWWKKANTGLSEWYRQWQLPYTTTKSPVELTLPRRVLSHFLAIRTTHGDFSWYHRKFHHEEANCHCTCGRPKTPDHLVRCKFTIALFRRWPTRPSWPPSDRAEGLHYLQFLLSEPLAFDSFLSLTSYYATICPR